MTALLNDQRDSQCARAMLDNMRAELERQRQILCNTVANDYTAYRVQLTTVQVMGSILAQAETTYGRYFKV
jgi:outer membrane protein TolC